MGGLKCLAVNAQPSGAGMGTRKVCQCTLGTGDPQLSLVGSCYSCGEENSDDRRKREEDRRVSGVCWDISSFCPSPAAASFFFSF